MKHLFLIILSLFFLLPIKSYSQVCKSSQHHHKELNEKQALSDFGYENFLAEISELTKANGYNLETDECLKNYFYSHQSNLVHEVFNLYVEEGTSASMYRALYLKKTKEFNQYLQLFKEHEAQLRDGFEKVNKNQIAASNLRLGGSNPSPLAACTNMDFELGNLSGWTTTFQSGLFSGGTNSAYVTTPGADPVVPAINKVFAGSFSACIDVLGSGSDLDWREIAQTFLVTNSNKDFVFYVAVVMDGGAHTCATNPFFNVSVKDASNNVVPCSAISLIGSGTGGVQCSSFTGWSTSGAYDFLRWTPVIVPLGAYVGQNVTIRYRVTRCNGGGGHGARAYLESSCSPAALNATGNLICPGKSVAINAPNIQGYSYSWSGPSGGAGSTYSINPTQGGVYTVTMSLTSNPSCKMILDTLITSIPSPTPAFNYTVTPCSPTYSVPFASTSTSYSTDPIATYNWTWGDATANGSGTNPTHTYASTGVKNVTLNIQSTAGCTATTSQSLQINVLPVSNFIKKNICVDAPLTFTNTSTPIANILTQTWNFGDGSSIDTQFNTTHTYTTPGVYTVTLSVTSTDLCSALSVQTLTVYPKPVLAASANTVCLNLTTVFTNSSTVASPYAITNWSWDFDNNGTTDNQAYAPTYGFNTIGTTMVELKGTTNVGCRDSILVPVIVNASQTANFTTGNSCINSAITINNSTTVAPPDFIVSYDWYFGANATPSVATGYNPTPPSYSTSGVKTITLNITSNTTCTASLVQSVEVYANPVAQFSVNAVCKETATEFTDLSTSSSSSVVHWQWDFENNGVMDAIGFNPAPNHVYPASGTYTAALVVTDGNSCRDTTTGVLDVWGHSVPDFSTVPTCFNSVMNFTNNTVNNVNPNSGFILTYDWTFGDGDSLNAIINPSHTYTTGLNGTTFNVTLYSTTNHFCIDKVVKTVTINPIPRPSFTLTNACLNSNVAIVNGSSIANTATITGVDWNFGTNAIPPTSTQANPSSLTYSLSGIKIVTLTLTSNQTCTASITDTVEVYEQPLANFTSTVVCKGTATPFADMSASGVGIANWDWDFDNNGTVDVIGSTNSASYTFPSSGTYTTSLIITDNNTCKDTILLPVSVFGRTIPDFVANAACFNSVTTFTNTTDEVTNPNVGGVFSYSWNFGDGSSPDPFITPTHTYTNSINGATYNVTLTVTSNHNCVDSVSKTVTIHPLPIPSFSLTNACLNTPVGFNNGSNISSPATISLTTWSFDANASVSTSTVVTPTNIMYNTVGVKTVTLNLLSNNSCTAIITNTVQIYSQPTANFSVTSVCQGLNSVFTDLSSSLGTITLQQWDFDQNGIIDATGSIANNVFLSSGTFTSSLIVTDNNTCKDTIQIPVEVWGHATLDFISNDACFNTVTTFTNLSTVTNSNAGLIQSYSWNFGDGSINDLSTNPIHTYTNGINGATYNVTLTTTTNHNCIDSIVKSVVINPLPNPIFTANNACINTSIGLVNSSTIAIPANIISQNWYFGTGASVSTSTIYSPTGISYNASGVKTVTLSLTSNQSCTSTVTNTVEIYAQPVANFSATAVCQGLATVFSDMSTPTGSIVGLQWDYTNDGFVDITGNSPTNIFSTSGTFTAALIVTDNHTCKDTIALPYDVWGHSIPDFTPKSVCYGAVSSFSNLTDVTTNPNVGGVQSYSWDFADQTGIVTTSSPNHIYSLGGNTNAVYNVTLTAVSSHSCIDVAVKTVSVFAVPTASFDAVEVCYGNATTFIDVSSGNGNAVNTYEWDFYNDGTTDITGIQNPNHIFTSYGNIPVSYTISTSPTSGLVCKNSVSKNIVVNPLPKPDFIFTNKCVNSQPNTFNANTTVLAVGTITNNIWNFGDGNTGAGTAVSHTYTASGNYSVSMTAYSDKGCFEDTVKQVTVYPKPMVTDIGYTQTCAGGTMSFSPIYINNGATVIQYIWDFDTSVNTQNPSHVFANGGSYTVNLVSVSDHACRDTFPKTIEVNYNPIPNFTSQQAGCGNLFCTDFQDLSAMPVATEQIVNWHWFFGDGAQVNASSNANQAKCFSNSSSSSLVSYDTKLVVTTNKGCTAEILKSNFITVYPKPVAKYSVIPNPTSVAAPQVEFINESQGYTKWWWNYGENIFVRDSSEVNPIHIYNTDDARDYYSFLIVSNQYNCKDTAYVKVEVGPDFAFYIPNAFTPNNDDGINDVFTGMGVGIIEYEMWVFDRWGTRVYYTDDIHHGWNGKYQGKEEICKQDVYVWKVVLKDVFGKKHEYIGHVTLIK